MPSTDFDLHSLFSPSDKEQWKQQIVKDLKGRTYESLSWKTPEGFSTEPIYSEEDVRALPLADYQRPQRLRTPGWLTVPPVFLSGSFPAYPDLTDLIRKGADGLLIETEEETVDALEWARLLKGVKLSETPVWFQQQGRSEALVKALTRFMPYHLKGGLVDEPISRRLRTGVWSEEAVRGLAEATRMTIHFPHFRTLTLSSHVFHDAGATAAQELAFLLASAADLLDLLTENDLAAEQLFPRIMLSVSVGTRYFPEIAKLRAVRILWQRFGAAYAVEPTPTCFLHARTSHFYEAAATPYTNLLRTTTEAMAAVIGGCDALTVLPYDRAFRRPDAFSERIARNVSILLKEEAHLDKTLDPAAGSYYLETLTHQLVEAAWTLFLDVEKKGGLLRAFEQGFIQAAVDQAYQVQAEALRQGRVMVGVTKFRVDEEAVQPPEEPRRPSSSGAPLLHPRRLAAEFE